MNLRQLVRFFCCIPPPKPTESKPMAVAAPSLPVPPLPKSAVVVPLYIYPLTSETWAPLYAAIENNPHLNFLVIVNPNSGPGETPSPDPNYARELPRLNSFANVSTIGYIRIDYCRKPLREACSEIARYASWSQDERQGLGLEGIFVDETPNHHSDERGEYLQALYDCVKGDDRIRSDRWVVHNPGTPPDALLAQAADVILVCEEPYSRYRSAEVQQRLREFPYDRPQCGYLVHSVPNSEILNLVAELRRRAAYLFVTEISGDFYERFGPRSWGDFMQALQ